MKNKIMQELEKMFGDAKFGKLLEIRFKAGEAFRDEVGAC